MTDESMSRWILTPIDDAGSRGAKHRLAAEVRALVEAAALVVPTEELHALAAATRDVADRVRALPRFAAGAAQAPTQDARLLERSPLSGAGNPLAPPIHVALDGDRVVGWAEYGWAYEGPAGCVHGGYVAAAFDDLLGSAQTLSGSAGFTGTLTVRMVRPTPLHQRIEYDAWLDSVAGRKILVRGTARAGGEVVAEAEGIFITPREGMDNEIMARMARQAEPQD